MKTFFKWISILVITGIVMAGAGMAGLYAYFAADLPRITNLKDYQPPVITSVYSQNNQKIAEFYNQRRIVIALEEMPKDLLHAFIAAEDARFYEHEGIDFHSIIRAFFKNIEAGRIVQGGSTITQQVAKSFFLTPERSYSRKLKEAILAYRIDQRFSKDQILFLYLNQIYLGHGAYGVAAAGAKLFRQIRKSDDPCGMRHARRAPPGAQPVFALPAPGACQAAPDLCVKPDGAGRQDFPNRRGSGHRPGA